jgi:predicted glycogen debranching enzyme
MSTPTTRIAWQRNETTEALTTREWLVTNGLGGYASGTLGGVTTRRFHGLLVAALSAPRGRTMVVNRVDASLLVDGVTFDLEGSELFGAAPHLPGSLVEVRFDDGLPTWRHEMAGVTIEKRVVVPHGRNTTCLTWRVVAAQRDVTLILQPAMHVRPHEGLLALDPKIRYEARAEGLEWSIAAGGDVPTVRLRALAERARSAVDPQVTRELNFREEQCRGYDHVGAMITIGTYAIDLAEGESCSLVMTTEEGGDATYDVPALFAAEYARRGALVAAADPRAREGMGADLVLAADAFVIRPATRNEEPAASGDGESARTIIAGYHWFTDWGRDTMISLEGLTLVTGRHEEARRILEMFAGHVKDGLIPNMFPEGKNEGLYHTADATLWFFHAIDRYLAHTNDRTTLRALLPTLMDIIEHHVRGTRFGIHVDPSDGLLSQGADGYQLTWMDAKVDDWVVTPRRGKAVEINALWFNALSLVARWTEEEQSAKVGAAVGALRDRARESFNRRFWCAEREHLYDVVDVIDGGAGATRDDPALRPNQLFAVSLPNPVLDSARWASVLESSRAQLLTPVGLRSLAPNEPEYKGWYDGDLRARDAAYHQGTVWAWLAGAFVDAHLRVHPDDLEAARGVVLAFAPHLGEACIGSISEVFDAESPFVPRGCVAQAWSVAEVLRAWVKTARVV